ncbi:MAG: Mut7-C RNAse domain-containing protein [Sulfurimonas sp.]|nr:Mut7-C RNAse domain-containing protein [Sulfurimonas sp.]MCK4974677.1 Mut7-C RNAse domain-containing protein [Sulfurimonas sp.]
MKIEIAPIFIADCHLGKLAKYLRVMGFDTLYFNTIDDNDLIELADKEKRIILTRDRALHEREKAPTFYLKPVENLEQLKILQEYFKIKSYKFISRCIICNTQLQSIEKNKVEDKIPKKVKLYFSEFEICPTCNRIYWHGDHYKRMMNTINSI